MHRTLVFVGLTSLLLSASAFVACSSTTTVVETNEAGADAATTDSSVADTATPEDSSVSPDMACAAMATKSTCQSCCLNNHQTGASTILAAAIACNCKGKGDADGGVADSGVGPCATECAATLCATQVMQPDSTCTSCYTPTIGSGGECQGSVATACSGDQDCVAEQQCVQQCTSLP